MDAMPQAAAPKNTQSEMPYTMRRVMANNNEVRNESETGGTTSSGWLAGAEVV